MTEISRINMLYAYVMVDPKTGVEGVVSVFDEQTATHVPLVSSRPDVAKEWEPLVAAMVDQSQVKISLVSFSARMVMEDFIPTSIHRG